MLRTNVLVKEVHLLLEDETELEASNVARSILGNELIWSVSVSITKAYTGEIFVRLQGDGVENTVQAELTCKVKITDKP